jgi:hypothetical protein
MHQFIKKLCHKLCYNLFDRSSTYCIQDITVKDKLILLTTPSIEQKVNINRKINNFCQLNRNRFWIIYYRLTERKIDFSCKRCNKFEFCQAYILKRIIKHIKAFDSTQESVIFKEARKRLLSKEEQFSNSLKKTEREIVQFYTQRVWKLYNDTSFDLQTATALIENTLIKLDDKDTSLVITERLQRYQLYQSPVILRDLFEKDSNEELKLRELSVLEILTQEKFINYIKHPLESRYIDFIRSSSFIKEINQDIDENQETTSKPDVDKLLDVLSNEDRLLYKLRYGFKLNNQEFLTISKNLITINETLTALLDTTEKLYIKFLIHYNLEENSEHFTIFQDKEKIKASISKKIMAYREKLSFGSYKGDEEIVVKFIYNEPLKAKELAGLFGLGDKVIYKKIERIKKRLKRLEIEQ